jgi:hypothetical protein
VIEERPAPSLARTNTAMSPRFVQDGPCGVKSSFGRIVAAMQEEATRSAINTPLAQTCNPGSSHRCGGWETTGAAVAVAVAVAVAGAKLLLERQAGLLRTTAQPLQIGSLACANTRDQKALAESRPCSEAGFLRADSGGRSSAACNCQVSRLHPVWSASLPIVYTRT